MLTGIIVALVCVAGFYLYSSARPAPPIDADFGGEKTSFTVPMPPDEVFRVVEGLPVSTNFKLGRADAQRRRVILHDSMTAASFGYFYAVDIAPGGDGSALTASIKSKFPQWGPITRRQREKFLGAFADALKAKLAGTI